MEANLNIGGGQSLVTASTCQSAILPRMAALTWVRKAKPEGLFLSSKTTLTPLVGNRLIAEKTSMQGRWH